MIYAPLVLENYKLYNNFFFTGVPMRKTGISAINEIFVMITSIIKHLK